MNKFHLFLAFSFWFAVCLLILFIVQYCSRDKHDSRDKKTYDKVKQTKVEIQENKQALIKNDESEVMQKPLQKQYDITVLDTKQKYLAEIASYTAVWNISQLETSFTEALDNWLTINEIKEALLHTYAYVGFPRSLNGMWAFQKVLEARQEAGIEDVEWTAPTEVTNIDKFVEWGNVQTELVGMSFNYTFVPGMDAFLKEHLFADLFLRWVLSYQERELVTIATLTTVDGWESQLGSHIRMWMNTGLTLEQIEETIQYVGSNLGINKTGVLENFQQ